MIKRLLILARATRDRLAFEGYLTKLRREHYDRIDSYAFRRGPRGRA